MHEKTQTHTHTHTVTGSLNHTPAQTDTQKKTFHPKENSTKYIVSKYHFTQTKNERPE